MKEGEEEDDGHFSGVYKTLGKKIVSSFVLPPSAVACLHFFFICIKYVALACLTS